MLVVYEESQLSDTTLIFSLPVLSLSLPVLSVSPSIVVSPLLSEILLPPASHYLKKNVFIAPFCIPSLIFGFFSSFYSFVILSLSLSLFLSGSWFEYLSCSKSKSMHHNLAPLHF